MSYILEALKKSEQQRAIGQVPGIDSEHERTPDSTAGNWIRVVVIVLALNAGLLALLLWPATETGTGRPLEPVAEPVTPVQQRTPMLARETPPPPVPERPLQPVAPLKPIPEPPPPKPRQLEPVALPAAGTTAVAVVAPSTEPQIAPSPVQAVQAEEPPPLPVWPQIPSHLFQQLRGDLHLDVHVHSEQVQDRFVLINLRKYHEGEKLQEGPQLDAITQEGVILSFRGQRFRVKAK